jgi:hypothetical protein
MNPLFLAAALAAAEPSLTIYNGGFAVVRDGLRLSLKSGVNSVAHTEITRHLEPDSVILRDPSGKTRLTILEQSFEGEPVSQDRLLQRFEGQTLSFETAEHKTVKGRLIRAPYALHARAMNLYGGGYYAQQMMQFQSGGQPIVDVEGRGIQFQLPGTPIFPPFDASEAVKPTLAWKLQSSQDANVLAELGYVTGGMTWKADYNAVGPEKGETIDLVGWVTMDNNSGKDFEKAEISLMAGDVAKQSPEMGPMGGRMLAKAAAYEMNQVTEKAFDEFHLYSLPRRVDLRDRQTKQVEFLRAAGVKAPQVYVYEGAFIEPGQRYWPLETIRQQREYGVQSNPKVWVMREIKNEKSNGLGLPLPKGKMRFYREDGAKLHFVGENQLDHTPDGELLRLYTGDAFDVVGERKRTEFLTDNRAFTDESFEIRVRNRKKEPVEVRIVERLYRGNNWELRQKSDAYQKQDSHTIEFRVPVPPGKERLVSYTVHYTW